MKKITCAYCGEKFSIRHSQIRKIFCTDKCRDDASRMQKAELEFLKQEEERQTLLYQKLQNDMIIIEKKKEILIMRESGLDYKRKPVIID